MIVQKYDISLDLGGGGKDKNMFIIGALENKHGPIVDWEGMDTLLMVVLIVGRTCSSVDGPFLS